MLRSSDGSGQGNAERIRVTLDVCRSDDPLLYDALAALAKGRRRVARLRTLAHDGLATNLGLVAVASVGVATAEKEPVERGELAKVPPAVTRALFEPPLVS
ncbi:hypothetical protein [Pseudorhodoferax sp. Leaf274]|uniref:hypothetical protein n=1 Tax=Pseudorhodoferax sp. Leaf274 TaxID=1736318 RepID=UPI0012E15478|nr:hypothetical protein [Pseudorhodoferax sp. Leaf274]